MSPEHFQVIISDLYEENYKSDFAKDLRENIDDLTDFDWIRQFRFNNGSVGVGVGVGGIGKYIGGNCHTVGGDGSGSWVGGGVVGFSVGAGSIVATVGGSIVATVGGDY